jgi:hypothetical protein
VCRALKLELERLAVWRKAAVGGQAGTQQDVLLRAALGIGGLLTAANARPDGVSPKVGIITTIITLSTVTKESDGVDGSGPAWAEGSRAGVGRCQGWCACCGSGRRGRGFVPW